MIIKPESNSHWYKRLDGAPCHEILGKNGKPRNPNIKDAIELDLVPSVTTVLKLLAKPGLEVWIRNQLLLSALTHPNPDKLAANEFAELILKESGEEAQRAANFGSRIHAAIEDILSLPADHLWQLDDDLADFVAPFPAFAVAHGLKPAATEIAFATEHFGGRIDFIGTFEGQEAIIDFKTQNTKGKKPTFYDEWLWQLAGYAAGQEDQVSRKKLVSVVIASDRPGIIEYKVWSDEEHNQGHRVFMNALEIWQIQNRWFERKRDSQEDKAA